jgi:hypothetical protein
MPASLTLLALLAACAEPLPAPEPPGQFPEPSPPAAPTPPAPVAAAPYEIRGTADNNRTWAALLTEDRMLLASPSSAGWHVAPRPQPEIAGTSHTFRTDRMTFAIEPGGCGTAPLPDRVTLLWDGGTWQGCGGPRPALDRIADTRWELVRLGTETMPADRSPAATMSFATDGRVGGSHVCNSIGTWMRWRPDGSFTRTPGEPAFVGTQIGCYGPGHAIGQRFWTLVSTARSWRRDGERLFVTGADGEVAELRFLL